MHKQNKRKGIPNQESLPRFMEVEPLLSVSTMEATCVVAKGAPLGAEVESETAAGVAGGPIRSETGAGGI